MPEIPEFSSPFEYLGAFFILLGVFLVLTGTGIIKVQEKFSVKLGSQTWIIGILFCLVGVATLFTVPSEKTNNPLATASATSTPIYENILPTNTGEPSKEIRQSVKIAISNSTSVSESFRDLEAYLQDNNFNVIYIDSTEALYQKTTIYDYTGNPEITQELVALLKVGSIYRRDDSTSEFDVLIVLGEDWEENNSLP